MGEHHEAEAILQEMDRIRCSLHSDVEDIVENARVMSDWRYYARTYPWACFGIATAVGYLVIPRRLEIMSPDAKTLAKLAKNNQLVVTQQAEPHKKGGFAGSMFTLLANLAVRGAISYVGQQMGKVAGIQAAEPDRPVPQMPR